MSKIKDFIRQEIVLCISCLAALISAFFVPPDASYLGYFDLRTLALLYCLMVVVAGIRKAGIFALAAHRLCLLASGVRSLTWILVGLSFFSAMFITNDVALLTFVPLAVAVLGMAGQERYLIPVVVLQTAAANLGSMLTPVGNPQNIYIQSAYDLTTADFLRTTLPVWSVSAILLAALCFLLPKEKLRIHLGEEPHLDRKSLAIYLALFLICLLTVLRVLSWPWMLALVVGSLLILDRPTLAHADFYLLLTFVFFFIFSGNLARIPAVRSLLESALQGRVYGMSLGVSQVISNVPAALLLSGFTDDARQLLLGVNVGGLGTPVASLASLISLKLYSHSASASTGRYLLVFTGLNLFLLAILSLLFQ